MQWSRRRFLSVIVSSLVISNLSTVESATRANILLEGRGVSDIEIGQSKASEVLLAWGKPDNIENTPYQYSINYVYKRVGLKINFHHEIVNTISTLPNFGGQTSRGITLRSSRKDVRATYGEPERPPGQSLKRSIVWTYPHHGVIFWFKHAWFSREPNTIEKIVIWKSTGLRKERQ